MNLQIACSPNHPPTRQSQFRHSHNARQTLSRAHDRSPHPSPPVPLSPCPYLPNPSPDLRLTQFNVHPPIPKVSIQTPTRVFTGHLPSCAIAPLSLTIIVSQLTPSVGTLGLRHTQVTSSIQQQPLQRNLGQTLSNRN